MWDSSYRVYDTQNDNGVMIFLMSDFVLLGFLEYHKIEISEISD